VEIFARRHWIPPAALIYAQLAHGFAWLLVLWTAWNGNLQNSFYGFAWIHTVALGWVTMAALAVLLHALPNFIDVPWRGETAARWSVAVYGAGVALLLFGFLGNPLVLPWAAVLIVGSLLVYLATAFATIGGAMRGERIQRAVARAFGGTFLFLLATVIIGFGLAWMLGGRGVPDFTIKLPAAHADLGTLGWLSLLIFGVSRRTIRPITGQMTRMRFMHILVGSCAILGVPLLAVGVAIPLPPLAWVGGVLFAIAAAGYAVDTLDIVCRARNPHRPPQAFIVAGIVWFAAALVLGAQTLSGKPWQSAYGFVLLMGWIGQFVNAHLYHIGIRLLSTVYRGEDDETRPQQLLEARLTWFSFFAFQIAIGAIAYALITDNASLAARASVFGITGWIAMAANVLAARVRAKILPKTIVLR
jgi:hypothetical protein